MVRGVGMAFPSKFLWGGSISAAQVEGGWDEGGKSPVQIDYAGPAEGIGFRPVYYRSADGTRGVMRQFDRLPQGASYELFDDVSYTNHEASDFYHHWREDLDLFAEMGFTTFNTTVSWARVYPHGVAGGVNKEGVEFYRQVFRYARELGMDPVITLYKYDEPTYFELTYGGWDNRAMIDEFVTFATTCFREYQGLVDKWLTFNEINVMMLFDPANPLRIAETHNQMVASARCVVAAHELDPNISVGCMIAGQCSYPFTCDPADVLANQQAMQDRFFYCADTMIKGRYPSWASRTRAAHGAADFSYPGEDDAVLAAGTADFLAFSYYSSAIVTTHEVTGEAAGGNLSTSVMNPYLKASEWGWQMDATGYRYWLNVMNDRYDVPLFDVENGLGALDELVVEDGVERVHDPYRIDYLRNHIHNLRAAIDEDGVNIFGYTTWGPIDLVAFTTGQMKKRYGFIYVDRGDDGSGDLHRVRKDSFWWYQRAIASDGRELD